MFQKLTNLTPFFMLPKLPSTRGAVAQFGRAPRSQCGGQGFDPPLLHQKNQRLKAGPRPCLFHLLTDSSVDATGRTKFSTRGEKELSCNGSSSIGSDHYVACF